MRVSVRVCVCVCVCAHIRNINMSRYITSARGHELSGRVRAHTLKIIIMPGLNVRGLAK